MDTLHKFTKCGICGLHNNHSPGKEVPAEERPDRQKLFLSKWKLDCVATLMETLFESTSPLIVYFQNVNYCSRCHQALRDLNFVTETMQVLHEQLISVSTRIKNLIEKNYACIEEKASPDDIVLRISKLKEDSNSFQEFRQEEIVEIIYAGVTIVQQNAEGETEVPSKSTYVKPMIRFNIRRKRRPRYNTDEHTFTGARSSIGIQDGYQNDCNKIYPEVDDYIKTEITDENASDFESYGGENESDGLFLKCETNIDERSESDVDYEEENRCKVCGKNFVSNYNLKRHFEIHTRDQHLAVKNTIPAKVKHFKNTGIKRKPYSCRFCKRRFGIYKTFKLHEASHDGNTETFGPTESGTNDEAPSNNRSLLTHNKIRKTETCSVCDKRFHSAYNLKLHMRSHTKEKPAYSCDSCGKTFEKFVQMNAHKKLHVGDKPHECKECGKCFQQISGLKMHVMSHTGERPYKCEVCQKGFKMSAFLKEHMRIHTGERPFVCDVCGKAFSQSAHLKYHAKIHEGKKCFICDICGKGFILGTYLKMHAKIHTGVKPYTCNICKKSFVKNYHLKIHMRTHTGEKPYTCHICGRNFTYSYQFRSHLAKHQPSTTVNEAC